MEFVADFFKMRVMTALKRVEPPGGNGFILAGPEHQEHTERVLKHLGQPMAGKPLASLIEPGPLGTIKRAFLLTETHFCYTRGNTPLKLEDIWDVGRKFVEKRHYPTVSAGQYRYTLLCSESCADYLYKVLTEIRRAMRLPQGAAAIFETAIAAHTGAPLCLTEELPAFADFTLDPQRLFAFARVFLVGGSDTARGLDLLLLSADLGNPDAQYALGLFFSQNSSCHDDTASGVYWFSQAAAQGHTAAQTKLLSYSLDPLLEKGTALWAPYRQHPELTQWEQGTPEERAKAGELCFKRANHCLALALVLTDDGLNPNTEKFPRCLRAFEALKETRAWLDYAQKLGHPEVDEHRKRFLYECRSIMVNEIIPELKQAERDQDAFDCQIWLAELGDWHAQIAVGQFFLEDTGLRRDPLRGLQWMEQASAWNLADVYNLCTKLGKAYISGAHLSAKTTWNIPLSPSPRDRAIGVYLLERVRYEKTKYHLPATPSTRRSLAEELESLPFPFAADLAAKYRASADEAAN